MQNEDSIKLNTFVSSTPHDMNTRSLNDLPMSGADARIEDFSVSSVCQYPGTITPELIMSSNGSREGKDYGDHAVYLHGMGIYSKDRSSFTSSNLDGNLLFPISRVVGFDCSASDSIAVNGSMGGLADRERVSDTERCFDNATDCNGSQVRKHVLSPLYTMLSSNNLHGDGEKAFDLAGCSDKFNSTTSTGKKNYISKHNLKKASIGKNGFSDAFVCPMPKSSAFGNMLDKSSSVSHCLTDGPVLENNDLKFYPGCLPSWSTNPCNEVGNVKRKTSSMDISPKKLKSPSLALSPLGRKWSDGMKSLRFERSLSGSLVNQCPKGSLALEDDENIFTTGIFNEINMHQCTSQRCSDACHNCDSVSAPTPHCFRPLKKLSTIPVRRSLIGSFEECLLSGRFSASKASQRLEGFLAVLNITGGSFSPPSQKLPFSVTSVDGDSYLLYYASIFLAGNSNKFTGHKLRRSFSRDDSRCFKSRLHIPIKGRIQLVLSNPEMTPVHTFFCNYDMSDMPSGTKTFIRQKVTLASSHVKEQIKDCHGIKGTVIHTSLDKSENMVFSEEGTSPEVQTINTIRTFERESEAVQNVDSGLMGCSYRKTIGIQQHDLVQMSENSGEMNSAFLLGAVDAESTASSQSSGCQDRGDDRSNGVLRYALHLRFLCTSKKCSKSIRKYKSDPFSVSQMDGVDERRFYLYNDLRVVFPQRHSDADEGELQVEHHFPANPKYFDISN